MKSLSAAVSISWRLAIVETVLLQQGEISPELFFMGITKLEDFTSPTLLSQFGLPQSDRTDYFREVDAILTLLANHGVEPRKFRHQLRDAIGMGKYSRGNSDSSPVHRSAETRAVFKAAEEMRDQYGSKTLGLNFLVDAILEANTPSLDRVLQNFSVDKQTLRNSLTGSLSDRDATTIMPVDKLPIGTIQAEEIINETTLSSSISEHERISHLAAITDIASHAKTPEELYEGCIQEMLKAIPNAERATILIADDNEFLPIKFYPRNRSYFSSSMVKLSLRDRKAFIWKRMEETQKRIPESMVDAVAAIYAPMILNGRVLGVLHVDSTSYLRSFFKPDMDTLGIIAGSIARVVPYKRPEKITPSVFISYSHSNRKFVYKLANDLRRWGVSVWMDDRLKPADISWRKQLAVAIKEQLGFIFVVTPKGVASEYCLWELETALKFEKRIIPIMYQKAEMPQKIAIQQYINFERRYKNGFDLLIETIERIAEENSQ